MTRNREGWFVERLGEVIILGIVGYYATTFVTDLKSLAILVIVGFVLVGWKLENISNALNVQSEVRDNLADPKNDFEQQLADIASELNHIRSVLDAGDAEIVRDEAIARRIRNESFLTSFFPQTQVSAARHAWGKLFDDHETEIVKILQGNPDLPFDAAVAQVLGPKVHPREG